MVPRGRLIFALDATASRQPSWDKACQIQAQMFAAVGQMGGLDIQLVYYCGFHDFEAFPWLDNAAELTRRMTGVACLGGHTQIGRVLKHAIAETRAKRVNALVFVGDCMEESTDTLCDLAGQLGVLGLPIFLFHEGREPRRRRHLQAAGEALRRRLLPLRCRQRPAAYASSCGRWRSMPRAGSRRWRISAGAPAARPCC